MRVHTSAGRSAVAIGLVATASLVAGCGRGSDAASPSVGAAPAATSTSAPRSAPATTAGRRSPSPVGGTGKGVLADAARATLAAGSARFTTSVRTDPMEGPTLTEVATGVQDLRKRAVRAALTYSDVGTTEIRLVDGVAYLKEPGVDTTKPWSTIDFAGAGIESGLDPSTPLSRLDGATDGLRNSGPATIGGVPTTHWAGTVDLAEAAGPRASLADQKTLGDGATTAHLDAYLDERGRYRRLVQTYVLPHHSTATSELESRANVVATLDFTDYGSPVTVAAPPASQVGPVRD